MVIVEIRPGCFVRMRPEDAAARGLAPAAATRRAKASEPEAAKTAPEPAPEAVPETAAVDEPRKPRRKAAADD